MTTQTIDTTLTDREAAQLSYALRLEQDGILNPTDFTLDRLRALAKLHHRSEQLAALVQTSAPQETPVVEQAVKKPRGRPRKPRSASPATSAMDALEAAGVAAGNGAGEGA